MGFKLLSKIDWNIFWNAFSAISTFLAVLVSLWLAKDRRKRRDLDVWLNYTEYSNKEDFKILITIYNKGKEPIVIVDAGFKHGYKTILNEINGRKIFDEFPIIIKPGEIVDISRIVTKENPDYKKLNEWFKKGHFTVRDNQGKDY